MDKWMKGIASASIAALLFAPSAAQATVQLPIASWTTEARGEVDDAAQYVSINTLIVKYKEPIPASVHRKLGTTVKRSFPQLKYDVVTLQKGKNMQQVMRAYAQLKAVKSVTPSFMYKRLATNDPKAEQMYALSLLHIDKAVQLAGNHRVTVAVIDTGIDTKHPELKGRVLPAYNAANPAGAPFKDVHGTHVAGIIGANANNGVGAHGVNPNVTILPIDVFSGIGAMDYVIAQGILYAVEQGAKVINMSLGGYFNSPILEEAVQQAIAAGVTVVAAAGNEATDAYMYPAAYDGVISVGATDRHNALAEFSNYGSSVDLVAPGVDVYSSIYDYAKGSSFAPLSGTSMAAPVVAGVASLLLSKHPHLKPYQVEWILERTATDLGEPGFDLTYGNGLVNPVAALQYSVKNVPKVERWNDDTILANAPLIQATERYVQTRSFTKSEEVHWIKMNVKKGESVQALLEGAAKYDYKLLFRFFKDGQTKAEKPLQVNDGRLGEAEAKLWTAKEDGVLAIGVTDANGNYSLKGEATYTLTVQSFEQLADDGNTRANPTPIESFPFRADGLTFTATEGESGSDRDYFRFTVKEPTIVKFHLSAVPGIDSSLGIYMEEDFNRVAETKEDIFPIAYANNYGFSKGETLTFEALPEIEYVVETASEPFGGFYRVISYPLPASNRQEDVVASAIPYALSAQTVTIPSDEDFYPQREDAPNVLPIEPKPEMENVRTLNEVIVSDGGWSYFPNEAVQQIKEKARKYTIGEETSAFIQFGYDQDIYQFTVSKTGVYQFTFQTPEDMSLSATLFDYDEKKDDLVPIDYYWPYDWMTGKKQMKWTMVLQEGKTYYMTVQNDYGQPSSDPYRITSKQLIDAPADKNEPNNEPLQATVMQLNKEKTGNFVLPNDVDMYYYKHRQANELLTLAAKPHERNMSLPQALRGTLVPLVFVVEDTNGNMTIDEYEYGKALLFFPNGWSPLYETYGSFAAKKNVGYFFLVQGLMFDGLSVQSYTFSIQSMQQKDEDAHSVVTNNVPSAPLALHKKGNTYRASGYMNALNGGDRDHYKLVADRGTYAFRLDVPETMDGVVSIYDAKGRIVQTFDFYGDGDAEIGALSLAKGTYYVVVEESLARPNAKPYTLSITKK